MRRISEKIANGLYKISSERVNKESPESYLICLMMAQISDLYHTGSQYDRESARLYFESDDFYKQCKVLFLDDIVVKDILTRSKE